MHFACAKKLQSIFRGSNLSTLIYWRNLRVSRIRLLTYYHAAVNTLENGKMKCMLHLPLIWSSHVRFVLLFSGLERKAFDNKNVTFEEHTRTEHNMWHYLYFIVLIKVKDPTEFTGPESYVHEMVKVRMPFYKKNIHEYFKALQKLILIYSFMIWWCWIAKIFVVVTKNS